MTQAPETEHTKQAVDASVPPPDIDGVVRTDSVTKQLYSTDASIYKIRPNYVIFPFNRKDVITVHRWSQRHSVPLTPRGGGTSLSGQSIGQGAVIDYSKHFDQILEWDSENERVRVQPGLVLEHLNKALAEHGYQFGPDVATANRATIGGMIGNNSAGAHSIRHGHTADHVHSLDCVLANGETVTFEPLSMAEAERRGEQSNLEGRLYRTLPERIQQSRKKIMSEYPELMRNVSGYALDRFLDQLDDGVVDFTQLICGSEGTLGTVIEAELDVVPAVERTGLVVLECDSLQDALSANREAIKGNPLAVELLDSKLLELAQNSIEFSRYLDWIEGDPEAVLIVETELSEKDTSTEGGNEYYRQLFRDSGFQGPIHSVRDDSLQQKIWKVRKSGLPLLLGIPGDKKPTTFVEDTAVDPDRLVDYVTEFQELVADHDTEAAFYGHSSVGCLHIRPLINLKSNDGPTRMRDLARDVVDLVEKYNGALSGEHGDGKSRSEWLESYYGDYLTNLFEVVKDTFDSDHRLNPGNIVDPQRMDKNLRFGSDYDTSSLETVQDFSEQGGATEIIERCNGSGVCRKENDGTMCPSYMVTEEEKHSTRGRANVLRGLIDGDLDSSAMTDGRLESVMELCISCKACKSECPSEVDMAPLNEEVQHKINTAEGTDLRSQFFAEIGRTVRRLASFQPLPAAIMSIPGMERLVKSSLDISPQRNLPSIAGNPFNVSKYPDDPTSVDNPVVLYVDTFSGYVEPDLARRSISLLKRLGYDPIVPDVPCCGRTLMSKGFLDKAQYQAQKTVDTLMPFAEKNLPILVLEPSCHSVLTDDLSRYVPGDTAEKIGESSVLISTFLVNNMETLNETTNVRPNTDILVHGHCHQKALVGSMDLVRLLDEFNQGEVEFVDSGCCGMAGSFGFEREHYSHSKKMANRKLVPAIKRSNSAKTVVAPGISCRQQINHFTDVSFKHPVEFLADAILDPSEV
jgi:FAD/FMN-containing dehydrogenase/Fe-S oxidoreductase